jgi:hypothetical protein
MFDKLVNTLRHGRNMHAVQIALSRGNLSASLREPHPAHPESWEFSAFSQNGEDGIIDYLSRRIRNPSRSFVEIGAADGLQNNSSFLAVARNFSGLMIEGDPAKSRLCKRVITRFTPSVTCVNMFVTKKSIAEIMRLAPDARPDLFSLDIDGNDYYIAAGLLETGLRPRTIAVEYNSALGPEKSLSITYQENFNYLAAHETHLYYGVSVAGWKRFFARHGYRFVTVDLRGVNAFFVDPEEFDTDFLDGIEGTAYRENLVQLARFGGNWEKQFKFIENLQFETID